MQSEAAFAAQLMACLDGIGHRIDPHELVVTGLDEVPPKETENIPQVPGLLAEALDALRDDHEFLLQGTVFNKDLVDTWID